MRNRLMLKRKRIQRRYSTTAPAKIDQHLRGKRACEDERRRDTTGTNETTLTCSSPSASPKTGASNSGHVSNIVWLAVKSTNTLETRCRRAASEQRNNQLCNTASMQLDSDVLPTLTAAPDESVCACAKYTWCDD